MKLLSFLVLVLFASSVGAQIYKWYDEKGRARYGENPPPGVSARLLAPPGGAASDKRRPSVDEQEAEFRRRQIEKREAEERHAAAAKVRARQCESLRAELSYTANLRLFRYEGTEKVYLSDGERKAHAEKLRALIGQHCR
jgi:hypothetical protein